MDRVNTIFTDIFYQAHALIKPPNPELENSMFSASTLGVIPRCLPSILGTNEVPDDPVQYIDDVRQCLENEAGLSQKGRHFITATITRLI